ncbi:Panacea domain-containing protein [Leucobacter chromiiresistens]
MSTAVEPHVSHKVDPFAVAAFFIRADREREDADVTPMKLHKLMYLAQANYLASTGHRMFQGDVEAFRHGPVVEDIRAAFVGDRIIDPDEHPGVVHREVPKDVDSFLSSIWEKFGDMSASQLRRLTHQQDPWKDVYEDGVFHISISDRSMREFFSSKVPHSDRVFHPNVVVVDASVFEDDDEADSKLFAFLNQQ